jgi:hypothetical protein
VESYTFFINPDPGTGGASMYQLIKAYGRTPTGWKRIEIGHLTIAMANYEYPAAQLFVQAGETEMIQLDLSLVYARLNNLDRGWTIRDWLSKQAEGSLVGDSELQELAYAGHLHVTDVWDYPVDVSIGNLNYGPGTPIPTAYRTDVVLTTRSNTDGHATLLSEQCLFTVNGRILPPTRINDRIFLPNARRFMAECGDGIETLSVWNFSGVGSIEWHPLTADELKPLAQTPTDKARDIKRYRMVTERNLSDATLYLVVDGHPQLLMSAVDVFDAHTAILSLHLKTCAEYVLDTPIQYRPTYQPMNLHGQGVGLSQFDPMPLLTAGFSGLIIIRNNDVNLAKRPLSRTDIPGVFNYPYPPTGIAVSERARIWDYTVDGYDGDVASIAMTGGIYLPKIDDTIIRDRLPALSKTAKKPPRPIILGGYMVNLYTLHKT